MKCNIMSSELIVKGIVREILDKNFEYTSTHKKIFEKECDSNSEDFREINQDEKAKCVNNNLSKITIHNKLQKLNLDQVGIRFWLH